MGRLRSQAGRKAPRRDVLDAGEATFRRKRPQLLKRYRGQFVALYQERVVGHDADDERLARRMFEKLGDAPFYIVKVEQEPTIHDLPSPEAVC